MSFYAVITDADLYDEDNVRLVNSASDIESVEATRTYDPYADYPMLHKTGFSITPIEPIVLSSTMNNQEVAAHVCRFDRHAGH